MRGDTVIISSIQQFLNAFQPPENYSQLLFRGQSTHRNLLPSIARKYDHFSFTQEREGDLLNDFALMGAPYLKESILKDSSKLDLLVMAQHYGLKTRLLDWTQNGLAALWFACTSSKPGDVYVYALLADNFIRREAYGADPFKCDSVRAFQPRSIDSRVIAQRGWFTLHCTEHPKGTSFQPLENIPEFRDWLMEFLIPHKWRQFILDDLYRFGISYQTLYPDLEGLTRQLNYKHALWRDCDHGWRAAFSPDL